MTKQPARFIHQRIAPYRGYNVIDTQTGKIASTHLGDGRSIHTGRTLAIREAKARNAATSREEAK